ncbi:Cof-type HAD-IIB family hydrolase [Lichenifustis flavocetrariae]|uniref:Cof-type HAD-IIB family hydrolase n=1 Tax=Lichenifustis flavocetrariae TaxID=2949735 RepID=A0AA41Z775_9HYPH|nr:Cof-type HAD-IIB family hydrolase [Lichenifustis flavocetrariae]MCW6511768.1 Cof-type HAD-IIB family hydrolase [Lichenifustis flavocetrariae]
MTIHSKIRLLLADVDGTLLTRDKVLTEDAKAAVHELRRAGIVFAITSGRPPRGMRMLIEPLGLDGAIAGFNGGVLFNPDMSVIESHRLDPATARQTVDLILGRGLDVWIYTTNDWLIRDPKAPHVTHETSNVRFGATIVPSFTPEHLAQVVKIVGISDNLALVAACEKAAQETLGATVSAERSQPFYLDVTHPEANKGAVAVALSRLHHIPLTEIATIGDMPNDIPMFRKSGFSIAMGNASDDVKEQAHAVTDNTEHEGFAKAVRRFILQPATA